PTQKPRQDTLTVVAGVCVDRGSAHRNVLLNLDSSDDAHSASVRAGDARSANHSSYASWLTTSTTIGMNAWSIPHSSAHCPRKVPSSVASNQDSLMYPGIASFFTPESGTHHECTTSAGVISRRTLVSTGTTRVLATSRW